MRPRPSSEVLRDLEQLLCNYRRAKQRFLEVPGPPEWPPEAGKDRRRRSPHEEHLEHLMRRYRDLRFTQRIETALRALDEHERAVIEAYYFVAKCPLDVARKLGCSPGQCRMWREAALEKLARALGLVP